MAQQYYQWEEILSQYDLLCKELTPLLAKADIYQGLTYIKNIIKKHPLLKKTPRILD